MSKKNTDFKPKLIRDDWGVMLINKISREWEWELVPMGIGPRKKIQSSRAFPTKEDARVDALQLARNCGLKIYSPNEITTK
jgi:hypothetical protein